MTSKMEYLDEVDNLEYIVQPYRVQLMNLNETNGMDIAAIITYLQDDGYVRCGQMFSRVENGCLDMVKVP